MLLVGIVVLVLQQLREMHRALEGQRQLFTDDVEWTQMGLICEETDDGEISINEALLDAEERAVLARARRRHPSG